MGNSAVYLIRPRRRYPHRDAAWCPCRGLSRIRPALSRLVPHPKTFVRRVLRMLPPPVLGGAGPRDALNQSIIR